MLQFYLTRSLYPSLQFGWDVAQFQTVSAEYMNDGGLQEEQEGSEEEEDEE